MNAILSFILCFAMLFSSTGALPAQIETAAAWKISNLTVTIGDESVALTPEARITAAAGAEEAELHFEIGSGERTLMPMSGEITPEAVRFTLGSGGRSYTLTNETFMEMAGITDEDAAMMEVMGELFLSYGKLLAAARDPEFSAKHQESAWIMLEALLGAERQETTVELGEETLPAVQLSGKMTGTGVLNMLDAAQNGDIPEMAEMVNAALKLVNQVSGEEPIQKFSDLAGQMDDMDEMGFNLDMIIAQGETAYELVNMSGGAEDEMQMEIAAEAIAQGDATTLSMTMNATSDGSTMSYLVSADATGPADAPASFDVIYEVISDSYYSYENSEGQTYESADVMGMHIVMNGGYTDGLLGMDMQLMAESASTYGYADNPNSYEESFSVNVGYDERREADDSVTGAVSIAAEVMDENFGVSFDLNRADVAPVDYFADTQAYELTADTESDAYNMLMADAMAIAADAMALSADDSVMALVELVEAAAEEEYVYEDAEEELPDPVPAEADEEDEEIAAGEDDFSQEPQTVATFEEAAEIFQGYVPAYTAPEGYSLQGIVVDEYSLTATYGFGDDAFELASYGYTSYDENQYYTMREGKLAPAEGAMVELMVYGDEVYGATVYSNEGVVSFFFYDADLAKAETILAGLQ